MVFEKVVVDILNRYLGDFVENLDSNQLSIGVWGGDVVLKDLILKQSALDNLDLPVQTVFGQIGKLTLKIPWKDPYNSPIEASVDGLFLLSKPNTEVKYDPIKEEKNVIQAKKAELNRLEEAKLKEKEKDKPKTDPGFIEKLSAQIIKNLQIYIKNIHIRYEDSVTYQEHFFAAGVTLGSLIMVTTDQAWKPGIVKDVTKIFKILNLEGFAVYWNCKTESFADLSNEAKLECFQNNIATKSTTPNDYNYILGPINSSAQLVINQKPELEIPAFSSPKILVNLEMEKLAVGLSKEQYQGIIALADSMDRMNKGLPYRKFRPCVPYEGHYQEWWRFAYKCIVETEIKRKKDNWDWLHIRQHRECCREYGNLYQQTLITKKPPVVLQEQMTDLEKKLDIVNLIIIRRKIELEVERTVVKDKEKKSWFSWFWGSEKTEKHDQKSSMILQEFENAMTHAEKQRLYQAIDYQESMGLVEYPETYVGTSCKFLLHSLEIEVRDHELEIPLVVTIQLNTVNCQLDMKPAVSGTKVVATINQLVVTGLEQDTGVPQLVSSNVKDEEHLLYILFEMNPMDQECGQRIHFSSKPLKIIYDAITINKALNIFKVPQSTALEQLSEATANSLNNVKQMTATGLQYAIEKHTSLELKIDLHAPYIIIPYGGKYTGNENVLVFNLGRLRMSTLSRQDYVTNVKALHQAGTKETEILNRMIDQSYDKFKIDLTDIQIVLAQSGEDWLECLEQSKESKLHILKPLTLRVSLEKCLITDDPRLPLVKVRGELPSLSLQIVNTKLIHLLSLIHSIPFPKTDIEDDIVVDPLSKSSHMLIKDVDQLDQVISGSDIISTTSEQIVQLTKLQMYFILNELTITLMDQEFSYSECIETSIFSINSLELEVIQKSFLVTAGVKLKSIDMSQFLPNQEIKMLHTQSKDTSDSYLINVQYTHVDKISPEFHTIYESCESSLLVDFATLSINLHLEGLNSIMQYVTDLQMQIEEVQESAITLREIVSSKSMQLKKTLSTLSLSHIQEIKQKVKRDVKEKHKQNIIFKLNTKMGELSVKFSTNKQDIASISLQGLNLKVTMKQPFTEIEAHLVNINVVDLNENNAFKNIISVLDKEAINAFIVVYKLEQFNLPDQIDMSVEINMGRTRIVFLNYFVTNILEFLNEFQAAQQAIIEASQEATKQAKLQVQAAYKQETRILLKIKIKAPDILIPSSSNSIDAVWLDLGNITLYNSFKDLCVSNKDGNSAVLDEFTVTLTDFTLTRATIKNKTEIFNEQVLLNPFNMILYLKRNLSASWYKDIPCFDLSLNMPELSLTICEKDYKIIMSILEGNFSEGNKQDIIKTASKPAKAMPTKSTISGITLGSLDIDAEEMFQNIHTFLNISVRMERFLISICTKNDTDGVGKFYLEGLSMKGKILSNNIITVSVLLLNCLIEDTRRDNEGKLNQLMQRKHENDLGSSTSLQPLKSMLDIIYQQNGNDMFVDLKVYSFNLILNMDFLMALSEFFAKAMPATKSTTKQIDVKQEKPLVNTRSSTIAGGEARTTNMTVHIKIEQPDIILVENMNSVDTKAMILNSEVYMKIRLAEDEQIVSGSIKDFVLYTCCYNPEKRANTKGYVLHPVNISIAGSAPEYAGLHMEVCITQVRLSISPAIIELLSACHTTMLGYKVTEETTVTLADHGDLWDEKPFKDEDYWFLKPDDASEALEFSEETPTYASEDLMPLKELCIVRLPSLIITIETGSQGNTLPMLFFESCFQINVNNWSSQMNVEATLKVQMAYYNNRLALWEPLIEPIQIGKGNEVTFKPWELKLEVNMAETDEATTPGDSEIEISTNLPTMTIDISSTNNLELTITKTSLEVFDSLSAAFASAMQPEENKVEQLSPYKFKNDCGLDITLLLHKDNFTVLDDDASSSVLLEPGAEVNLQIPSKYKEKSTLDLTTEMEAMNKSEEYYIHVFVNEFNCELVLPIVRADTRYYSLKGSQKDMGLVCDIKVLSGIRIITLRTIIQVHNNFKIAVDAYYMTDRGNELELIAAIQPNTTLNIPFKSVYTSTNEIFFSVNGFTVTRIPYVWKELQSKVQHSVLLFCDSKNPHLCQDSFIIKAHGETNQIFYENTSRYTILSTNYTINLGPAVVFKNCLPIDIVCCFETTVDQHLIKPGETTALPNLDPTRSSFVLRIPEYLEKEWSCTINLSDNNQNFSVWTFQSNDSAAKMFLDLGISMFTNEGFLVYSVYCPFWMINKTGFLLSYRKSKKTEKHEASGSPLKASDENLNVLHHPASFKGPILFSFNAKNFFGKKKACIRMENGEWSDKFSLDVAGSSGVVVCKLENTIYQIGVHNQLTYNGLTKQVTFTPYFILLNNSPYLLECQEADRPADPWIKVDTQGCSAFWPKSDQEDKLLKLRVSGTEEITAPFLITESHTSLLKLANQYGGINVDIQMIEGAIYINLTQYDEGMAPAIIMNHTKNTMSFWEKDTVQIRKLKPNHYLYYTWSNPSGQRVLVWDIGKNKDLEDELKKDGVGQFSPKENHIIYWVSFLNGMQRVLLFTSEASIAEEAQSAGKFEHIDREITCSIHGVGLSLVNNITRTEIMYLAITSTGILWEQCKLNGKRYKQINSKDSNAIEQTYQLFLSERLMHEDINAKYTVNSKIEVDFAENIMLKPRKRLIRRTFETGFWIQMKTSPNQMQLHGKVNRIQIDNQMYDCIFPVVLAPVPPPKSVALSNGHKPFIELSIVQLLIKNSQIRQFKYFKILIQEFHIKVDLNFVNVLMEVLQTRQPTMEEERESFEKNIDVVNEPLYAHASLQSRAEQKSFYDLLHFSPLKIHVSFTLPQGQQVAAPNFLTVLLQGVGVTLTNLQDVIFKLAYFERNYSFLTQKQLTNEATQHYVGQAVKQLYVLVLGLDVIGNPYGLVIGITKGVEDLFYEPIQGAIQGPGEFAEGLVLGVRSLFGHTVGGAAGAVSRITGAMGKGIAALTFDKDYQRKRNDQINKKPATVQEGFARGGKGLVMGVVDGVTGVFTKPIAGAKEQGVGGFFKGLGKGAVGLVTRPTAGVIDFTSGSLDAVKRATEMSSEVTRIRTSRFCQADGLVRPYNIREAEGNKLLIEMEKGKYGATDIYSFHYEVIEKKEILLLTDKRLAYITHNDIFGGWQIEWSHTWQELPSTPLPCAKGVLIAANDARKKKMNLFGSHDNGKLVLVGDINMQEEICNRIEDLKKKAISL